MADFPGVAREYATGFSIGNKGYIGLGISPAFLNDFYEYNPKTNVWNEKADFLVMADSQRVKEALEKLKGFLLQYNVLCTLYLKPGFLKNMLIIPSTKILPTDFCHPIAINRSGLHFCSFAGFWVSPM